MSVSPASAERSKGQPASHEAGLLDHAERLAQHREGRRAVQLHLSKLSAVNRREHHIRIAVNTFEPLLRRFESKLFRLWNEDLIVVLKGASLEDIDNYVHKLRFLFSADPLVNESVDGGDEFCTLFDMLADQPRFLKLAQDYMAQADHERQRMAAQREHPAQQQAQAVPAAPGAMLTPAQLERFESAIERADLIPMIQRQMICAFPENSPPKPVMCEFFVSIQALQKKFLPGVECASDRWLFQHLSHFLDHRMLSALPDLTQPVAMPVTININVRTLLSPEFLKFDTAMNRNRKPKIIFELQIVDILSDMGAYLFAREFLRGRGYGVALDGLDHLTFQMIDPKILKLDFEKIQWRQGFAAEVSAEHREAFVNAIHQAGASRVILCRCDDQHAIDFGRQAGIALFQGRHLDRMLAAG